MPLPLAGVLGAVFSHVIAAIIFKLLLTFGVGFVSFFGVSTLIEAGFDEIESAMTGLPADVIKVFIILRIDDAISVLSSAVSIRLALKTFGVGGEIRKLQFGLPAAP